MNIDNRFNNRPLDQVRAERMKKIMWEEIQKQHALHKNRWAWLKPFSFVSRYASVGFAALLIIAISVVAPSLSNNPTASAYFELIPNTTNVGGVDENVTSFTLIASQDIDVEEVAKSLAFYPATSFEVIRSGDKEFQILLKEKPQPDVQYTLTLVTEEEKQKPEPATFSWTYSVPTEEAKSIEIVQTVTPVPAPQAISSEIARTEQTPIANTVYQDFFQEVVNIDGKKKGPEDYILKYVPNCEVERNYDTYGQLVEAFDGEQPESQAGIAYYLHDGGRFYGEHYYQEVFAEKGSIVKNAGYYATVYLKDGATLETSYGQATIYFENSDDIQNWYDDVNYVSCGNIAPSLSWVSTPPAAPVPTVIEPNTPVYLPPVIYTAPTVQTPVVSTPTSPTPVATPVPDPDTTTSSSSITPESAPVVAPEPVEEWTSYTNALSTFQISYPTDWEISVDSTHNRVSLISPEKKANSSGRAYDISIRSWDSYEELSADLGREVISLDVWVKQSDFNYLNPSTLQAAKLGGASGYLANSYYDGSVIYLLEWKGRIYEVDQNPNEYQAEKAKVMESLRFL